MPEQSREHPPALSQQGRSHCAGRTHAWVLVATILGSSMAFIDGTVVNVALPALQSGLHATVVDVQWVIESYGLLLSALILAGGALGDTLGRRKVFVAGTAVFAAASVGCSLSRTIPELVLARSLQGVGAALLVPGSLALISSCFDEESRGRAIGTWSSATAITMALGPVLGGWLIQHASWRWAFLINAPLAIVVIAISILCVPESRNPEAKGIDWIGSLLATLGLAGVVFGFLESSTLGWRQMRVFGALTAGVCLLIAFVLYERSATSPMMPLQLFKSRNFAGANLLTLLLYAALGIFFFVFPLNLIQVQHYSTTATGAAGLPMIILVFLMSRWAGGLVARFGPELPLVAGPCVATAGFLMFLLPSVGAPYLTGFFPAFVVLGLGMSLTVAPLTTVVMTSVDDHRPGTASGINNAVSRAAGVLAIAVLGPVLVKAFAYALKPLLDGLKLTPDTAADVQSHIVDLGAMQPPAGLQESAKEAFRYAVEHAFVYGFRWAVAICAGLAFASAVAAMGMISAKKRNES